MKLFQRVSSGCKRVGYLIRAAAWATVLGIIETVTSKRGRRILAVLALSGAVAAVLWSDPIRSIAPGEVGIRVNRLTGGVTQLGEGWAWVLPGIHRLRRYPLRDQVYRPRQSASATGPAPFQSVEGLSIGVEVTVRYAFDPARIEKLALKLPTDAKHELIEPVVDGVLHRTFARHTVREIFSSDRAGIEADLKAQLAKLLGPDGVVVKNVFLGSVDLPADYRKGLESLLTEELAAEKMRYTLELKKKQVKEAELEAKADKARREQAAEAAAQEQIIAARGKVEAMKHILPLKKKEIEEKRLEAEASRARRVELAKAEAEARQIEAAGEAASRRKLAKAEAYRMEVTGKASSDQLARESALIHDNPLLIQKTLADKLSDKIRVIIAPPGAGFLANRLLGGAGAATASGARP